MYKKALFALVVIAAACSCGRMTDQIEPIRDSSQAVETRSSIDPNDVASGPGNTILGAELENPYEITNINAAYLQLTGEIGNLAPTHHYLKLLPTTFEQMLSLDEFEETYDYEFDTEPIHYVVLYDGDEGYVDASVPQAGGFSPEFGAITAAHYDAGIVPDMPYEVVSVMHIPVFESRLTFTAFVISGNEKYYEAIDGYCHPDCPTWPDCLDEPELTCVPDASIPSLETMDPFTSNARQNFPGYILDQKLGKNGDIEPWRTPGPGWCSTVANSIPTCDPNCFPLLLPISWSDYTVCEWRCGCYVDLEDEIDPPPGPPSGLTEECGCYVYDDERKPGGKILVEDTQIADEGLQYVKVKTRRRWFGFQWNKTTTDENGCWKIDKKYNVKRVNVKVKFRDQVHDRFLIRSWRDLPWSGNSPLRTVRHKWKIKRSNKDWNSLCLTIYNDSDNNSKQEEAFMAATVNNAIHEYYDDHSSMPSPGRIRIVIQNLTSGGDAAPMYNRMDKDQLTISDFTDWIAAIFNPLAPITIPLYSIVELNKPDVVLYFGDGDESDFIKETVYHEMCHVSQYSVLGANWWLNYVNYIAQEVPQSGQPAPYGDGTHPNAGLAELTEGMAYAVGTYFADLQYGLNHSRGGIVQNRRWVNLAEETRFAHTFLPAGLFFDLFDDNAASIPSSVTALEPSGVTDNIGGITFEQQLNALGTNGSTTIADFETVLWTQFGIPLGINQTDFQALFNSY
jgi:hypothetical protein